MDWNWLGTPAIGAANAWPLALRSLAKSLTGGFAPTAPIAGFADRRLPFRSAHRSLRSLPTGLGTVPKTCHIVSASRDRAELLAMTSR
jgi:pimeloyl-ACP methyl ester carboxylesterase